MLLKENVQWCGCFLTVSCLTEEIFGILATNNQPTRSDKFYLIGLSFFFAFVVVPGYLYRCSSRDFKESLPS